MRGQWLHIWRNVFAQGLQQSDASACPVPVPLGKDSMHISFRAPSFTSSHAKALAYLGLLTQGWIALGSFLPLQAQSLTLAGSQPSVDLGVVPLCRAAASATTSCSKVGTLTYSVTSSGMLGEPKVLTLGSPDLDFTLAPGTTCQGDVTAGTTCVVQVKFTPRFAGARAGGVLLVDASGKVVATTPIHGTGQGPQIEFDPYISKVVQTFSIPAGQNAATNYEFAANPVVDGVDDLFLSIFSTYGGQTYVVKTPADGSASTRIGTFNPIATPLALDGPGNLYVSTNRAPTLNGASVLKLPSGGGPAVTLPFPFESDHVAGLAADGEGDVFAGSERKDGIYKLAPGAMSATQLDIAPLVGSLFPVADADGDLFLTGYRSGNSGQALVEYPAGGESPIYRLSGDDYSSYPVRYLSIDGVGNAIYTSDRDNIRELPASGSPLAQLVAGKPDAPGVINVNHPLSLTVDGAGNIFVLDRIYSAATNSYRVLKLSRDQAKPVSFGDVLVGNSSAQSLRIFNGGNTTLIANPVFSNSAFALQDTSPQNCLSGLPAGAFCTLDLTYSPSGRGEQDGTLTLKTNGVSDSTISLQANAAGVATPVLSLPSGLYGGAQTVTITAPTPGSQIFYTTDGSLPTASSKPYVGPIVVASSQTLEAVALAGEARSPLALGIYTIAPGALPADHNGGFAEGCTTGVYGGFQCAGSARVVGTHLRLTDQHPYQAGIVRNTIPVSRAGFTTDFTFQLTDAVADGFTFLLETDRSLQPGHTGKSLGYEGLDDSLALKFDLYNNLGEGDNSLGLFLDGAFPAIPSVNLEGSGIDLHSGHVMLAHITYDASNLVLTLTDTASLATFTHAFPVDLATVAGAGAALYPGFTGGTGSASATQDILSWAYVSGAPGVAGPPPAIPPLPNFPDGITPQGLSVNGSAAVSEGVLALTDGKKYEAGSAFYAKPVPIQAFTTDFTVSMQDAIADGLTFVIQNTGPSALGGNGLQLGYGGIAKSVAVKFDLYNNDGEGEDSTGLYLNGVRPTAPFLSLVGSGIDLRASNPIAVHLTYDGTTLNMTLTDTAKQAVWTHAFTVDIPGTVGSKTAYVGFTGATALRTVVGQVLNWTFINP